MAVVFIPSLCSNVYCYSFERKVTTVSELKILGSIAGVFLAAISLVIIGSFFVQMERAQDSMMPQFAADAKALDFTIDDEVWQEGKNGQPASKVPNPRMLGSTIKLNVLVSGCSVELTRKPISQRPRLPLGPNNSPVAPSYVTSGVSLDTAERLGVHIAYPPQANASIALIQQTLAEHPYRYPCYTPAAQEPSGAPSHYTYNGKLSPPVIIK